jgi:hypothetical protein
VVEGKPGGVNWPRNALALAGLALLTGGAAWAWPPAGLIVPGCLLFASAVWAHVRGR